MLCVLRCERGLLCICVRVLVWVGASARDSISCVFVSIKCQLPSVFLPIHEVGLLNMCDCLVCELTATHRGVCISFQTVGARKAVKGTTVVPLRPFSFHLIFTAVNLFHSRQSFSLHMHEKKKETKTRKGHMCTVCFFFFPYPPSPPWESFSTRNWAL